MRRILRDWIQTSLETHVQQLAADLTLRWISEPSEHPNVVVKRWHDTCRPARLLERDGLSFEQYGLSYNSSLNEVSVAIMSYGWSHVAYAKV